MTVDPLAPARFAADAKIEGVINLQTGETHDARSLIEGHTHEAVVKWRISLREALHRKQPRLACDLCHKPAYLVCSPTKAFFFRHLCEDGTCTAITRAELSAAEVRARQYQGLRESDAHRTLKGLIEDSLSADPAFADIAVESTWRGEAGRRRPDVSARVGDLALAFEGQLSTTFLSVVVERREFYRQAGGLLVWILASFDPTNRRMTEDDIVFPNNSNVLVVDEETRAASRAAGRFTVTCWNRRPRAPGAGGLAHWDRRQVAFADLSLDQPGQRAFLVDVEQLEADARAEARRSFEAAQAALRADFVAFLENSDSFDYEEELAIWRGYHERFLDLDLSFPSSPLRRSHLQRWSRVVGTALTGSVHGWNLKNLPQVAHHLHDQHPGLLYAFGALLRASGYDAALRVQDHTGRWRAKIERLRDGSRADRDAFQLDTTDLETVCFLFPVAAPILMAMLDRRGTR